MSLGLRFAACRQHPSCLCRKNVIAYKAVSLTLVLLHSPLPTSDEVSPMLHTSLHWAGLCYQRCDCVCVYTTSVLWLLGGRQVLTLLLDAADNRHAGDASNHCVPVLCSTTYSCLWWQIVCKVQGGSNMTGKTVTCLHTNRPGHIWTTLYVQQFDSSPRLMRQLG
jgi:hypothetical protein